MPPIILPIEIEETILDLLVEDDEGRSTLKTCSLVCQAFLPICRKHIFKSIALNHWNPPPNFQGYSSTTRSFDRLLCETPEIADYIRILDYNIKKEDLTTPSIRKSLKRISRLESLTVSDSNYAKLDWSNNPIRSELLHLLHLPTLTQLVMSYIDNFVVSDLIPCVNLKYLFIGHYTTVPVVDKNTFLAALPEHSIQLNGFGAGSKCSAAIMELCTARRPDGQPIIDFGSLSMVAVNLEEPRDVEASQELIKNCHTLTDVRINCK